MPPHLLESRDSADGRCIFLQPQPITGGAGREGIVLAMKQYVLVGKQKKIVSSGGTGQSGRLRREEGWARLAASRSRKKGLVKMLVRRLAHACCRQAADEWEGLRR